MGDPFVTILGRHNPIYTRLRNPPSHPSHPPCSVETNKTLSLGCNSYLSSPSSSQSASLIRTKIPGRLHSLSTIHPVQPLTKTQRLVGLTLYPRQPQTYPCGDPLLSDHIGSVLERPCWRESHSRLLRGGRGCVFAGWRRGVRVRRCRW